MAKFIEPWWGDFSIAEGQAGFWQVGPMRLWVEHHAREWRIAVLGSGEGDEAASRVEVPCAIGRAEAGAKLARYSFQETTSALQVTPLLADRPVISKPDIPLFIPPQQSITLYVGSPLWLQVSTGEQRLVLQELPLQRPSDTWAGPLTREGGLCYASTTMARTDLEGFPFSPLRALTPIAVRNRASDTLAIERLNLPVPYLALYQADNGTLWTQGVALERGEGGALSLEPLEAAVPQEAGSGRLLAEARSKGDRSLITKAFSTLFG